MSDLLVSLVFVLHSFYPSFHCLIPPSFLFATLSFLMVQVALVQATLDNTVGVLFLGVVLGALLLGINFLQSYIYFHEFPNDSRLHRISVLALCLLDALHLALAIHCVYAYVITGFGYAPGLTVIAWSIKLQVSVNVVVILIVQCLYTTRVWLLGSYHRGALGYIVASIVASGFAIGILFAYFIYTIHTYAELSKISWVVDTALSLSTSIDFVIAAAMCYYLWKSKGQIRDFNSRISTAIQYTLASGLLTSACSLSALFSYILLPQTFVFVALQFLLTKLYVGSYLAMLNARQRNDNGSGSFGITVSVDVWRTKTSNTSSFWSPRPLSTVPERSAFSELEADWQKLDGQC